MLNLSELLLNLVKNDLSKVDEKANVLRLFGVPLTLDNFNLMKLLNSPVYESEIHDLVVTIEDINMEVSLDADYLEAYTGENTKIKLEKKQEYGLRFLFEKGFESYLSEKSALEEIQCVKLDFIKMPFSSLTTSFIPNFSSFTAQEFNNESIIQAIKYSKALNSESQKYLPTNVLTWLSRKNVKETIPKSWQKWSALRLFCSLSSELLLNNNTLEYYFRGERRKKISLNLQENDKIAEAFLEISECADWVFGQSKDIETRHYLFNHQMALSISDNEKIQDIEIFKSILRNAIDNANLTYRYHLQNSSKELAKTLTDLNKTLFEYVGKIRQNTTELINGLWRDLTTVIGLLMLNFALKKPDVIGQNYNFLGSALCIYLILSIFLNGKMGFWFFKNVDSNLDEWRSKIYSYLTDIEFIKFAKEPLKQAFKKYKLIFYAVLIFYLFMIWAVAKYTFLDNIWNFFKNYY